MKLYKKLPKGHILQKIRIPWDWVARAQQNLLANNSINSSYNSYIQYIPHSALINSERICCFYSILTSNEIFTLRCEK